MHAAYVPAELFQRRDRLARAVQNHVGRVEVDKQVRPVHVVNERQQRVGRLLTGLQVQRLPLPPAMIAHLPGHGDDLLVQRVGRVVRHKAQVQGHHVAAQQARKSAISIISFVRAARVSRGTNPTVRTTVGMSA